MQQAASAKTYKDFALFSRLVRISRHPNSVPSYARDATKRPKLHVYRKKHPRGVLLLNIQ